MPRPLEFLVALLGLIVLLPLMLCIAAIVKLSDRGPVFYRAQRIGFAGKEFSLLKFRTMVVGADAAGAAITSQGDVRVTLVGKWLRKYKLDELPQLFNVLAGDMSFVGPRPEDPRYVALYSTEQRRVLSVRPGITSPASLYYKDEESLLHGENWEETYVKRILPHKLSLELEYQSSRSAWSDLRLICRTLLGVAR